MKLYVSAKSYVTEYDYDVEDQWDRPDTSTEWFFGDIYLSESRFGYDDLDIDLLDETIKIGDVVYVTVVVWSDGNSFGHDDCRNAEIFSVHRTREAANKAVEVLESPKGSDLGDGYKLVYRPWDGYFESQDYVEIIAGVVT